MKTLEESINAVAEKLDLQPWIDLRLGKRYTPVGNLQDSEAELVEEKPKEKE